jgi:hypothetical protein
MTIMNLVTPRAGAKHKLLFNKRASEADLLNKGSYLARALGVTKFIKIRDMILVTLCYVLLESDLFNKPTSKAGANREVLFNKLVSV